MRLIVGAPVAHRAWSIPHWMACLASQTRRPDGLVFVHSGQPGDDTWQTIQREAARHHFPVQISHDPAPAHPRQDNERFRTLARIRNHLLDLVAIAQEADLFLSLDTDIMLEDPRTIERLQELIDEGVCDIAQPVAFLHPGAPRHWHPSDQACWAYNFAFLPALQPADPRRVWKRPPADQLPWGELMAIQIPMAVWLGNRRALSCRYEWHMSGEDIGFGQALEAAGVRAVVDTDLYAFHAWDERHLADALAVPA